MSTLYNLGKTIEEYSLALEEFVVGKTEKLDKFIINEHKKHLETSKIIWFSKTKKNIILQLENDARLYFSRNWKLEDYFEKCIPQKLRNTFLILLSDYTPICHRATIDKLYKNKFGKKD